MSGRLHSSTSWGSVSCASRSLHRGHLPRDGSGAGDGSGTSSRTRSPTGEGPVSKADGRRFEPCRPCYSCISRISCNIRTTRAGLVVAGPPSSARTSRTSSRSTASAPGSRARGLCGCTIEGGSRVFSTAREDQLRLALEPRDSRCGLDACSVEHAAVLQRPDRGASVVSGGDATVPSVMCCGLFAPGLDRKRRRSIERIEPPSDSHRAIGSDGMGTSHPVMQPQRHHPSGGRLGLAHPVSTVAPPTNFTAPPRVRASSLVSERRGMYLPVDAGATTKCQLAAVAVGGGTTSTGRCACWTTPWETEPSTNDLNAERPRAPVTMRAASRSSAIVRIVRAVPS